MSSHRTPHLPGQLAPIERTTPRPPGVGINTQAEPMDTRTIYGRPGMATAVETPQEWAVVAHLRGHCHDSINCLLCTEQALTNAQRDRAERNAHRAREAEMTAAYLARDLQEAKRRLFHAQRALDSIIEG